MPFNYMSTEFQRRAQSIIFSTMSYVAPAPESQEMIDPQGKLNH